MVQHAGALRGGLRGELTGDAVERPGVNVRDLSQAPRSQEGARLAG